MIDSKNIIITLTGDLGSGKGTVSQILKDKYNFITYSTGDVQRQIAKRYNMTTLELNKYAEEHPEIDDEIDSCFVELSKSNENLIVDSRMAWHFIPDSFKVYLKVDIDVAASRIMGADRGDVETYKDIEDAKAKVTQRKQSENNRFLEKYKVDCANMNNFNLVVDSTYMKPEEIAKFIFNKATEHFSK